MERTTAFVGQSKEQLSKLETVELRERVEKKARIAMDQYFDGRGNGSEAKMAAVVVSTLAREKQAENNRRQLNLIEERLKLLNK